MLMTRAYLAAPDTPPELREIIVVLLAQNNCPCDDCDSDGFGADEGDCDDEDSSIHPGADEPCDGVDNDCDGEADEGLTRIWYEDRDDDGYGVKENTVSQCAQPAGWVAVAGDCDDDDPDICPDAEELCDGLDNDCDGEVDEGLLVRDWYEDRDEDGYGVEANTVSLCAQPAGGVSAKGDCDDGDSEIHLFAREQSSFDGNYPTFSYVDLYAPPGQGNYYGITRSSTVYTLEPGFLSYDADGLPVDLHLALDSPLIDLGDPSILDPDDSRSDLVIYGGPGAEDWDRDGDGFYDYFWPGTLDDAPAEFDPGYYDCNDQDAEINPGEGNGP